jgi:hypothetical protein
VLRLVVAQSGDPRSRHGCLLSVRTFGR